MLRLMLDAAASGRINLERLADFLSEAPARLYPRRGAIQIGSDADFTVIDIAQTYALEAACMHVSCGWIPYEGWRITGMVTHTIIRGNVVAQNGEVLGKPGWGRFVKRAG
jgi:dihydroorotase-like cyclic amidohydrolase